MGVAGLHLNALHRLTPFILDPLDQHAYPALHHLPGVCVCWFVGRMYHEARKHSYLIWESNHNAYHPEDAYLQ
jgi:hypothetical protein